MRSTNKRLWFTVFILLMSIILVPTHGSTVHAKTKLNTTKITLNVGKSKTIKVSGTNRKVKWKIKSGKKYIKLSSIKKKSVKITAKKVGIAKVQAIIGKKKLTCKITVKKPSSKKNRIEVPSLPKEKTISVGECTTMDLTGSKDVYWMVDDAKKVNIVADGAKVTITGLNSGKTTLTAIVGNTKQTCIITIKEKYTYELIPLLPPFNQFYYLKTEDPEPYDLRFVDKESIYYKSNEDIAAISPVTVSYFDVKYENPKILRVKGGYICNIGFYGLIDGGTLTMQRRVENVNGYYFESTLQNIVMDGIRIEYDDYEDTTIKVNCPTVKSYVQYLVDTYGATDKNLFDKLYDIQGAMMDLSFYPRDVQDTSKVNSISPYPFLSCSMYPEIELETHIQMYQSSSGGLLTYHLYPFILNSLSFPSTIARAAKIMDPSCEITAGNIHSRINVTKDGVTMNYGGAGFGSHNPFYSNKAKITYLFDDSANDYAKKSTLSLLFSQIQEYAKIADNDAAAYLDVLCGDTYSQKVGTGSWLKVYSGSGYTYVTHISERIRCLSNVWVDGRYINKYHSFEPGARFAEHQDARIILRNQTFTQHDGTVKTDDIIYIYNSENDEWQATDYYIGNDWWNIEDPLSLPEEFILTREEIKQMNIDGNTNTAPQHGYIYDGTTEPGTPF